MALDYENMLKEGKSKLPEISVSKERFEVPKVKGHIEGNKTIIESEILSRGYYIKPIGKQVIKIVDKAQENLLTFVK